MAHYKFVQELARLHGWQVAVKYDVLQHFLVAQNPRHDLGLLDPDAVSLIVSCILLQQLGWNVSGSGSPLSTLKCSFPSDANSVQSPLKKFRDSHHCFRCGAHGHLPADCKAKSTSARHPTFPLAGGDAKSKHALLGPDNKIFCFTWARNSFCPFGGACVNYHGCSICQGSTHGAKTCRVWA